MIYPLNWGSHQEAGDDSRSSSLFFAKRGTARGNCSSPRRAGAEKLCPPGKRGLLMQKMEMSGGWIQPPRSKAFDWTCITYSVGRIYDVSTRQAQGVFLGRRSKPGFSRTPQTWSSLILSQMVCSFWIEARSDAGLFRSTNSNLLRLKPKSTLILTLDVFRFHKPLPWQRILLLKRGQFTVYIIIDHRCYIIEIGEKLKTCWCCPEDSIIF